MTQQTGIAGVVESASTEHNAKSQHRWDDLDYVRQVIANGGSYNALELIKALECALEKTAKAERHYIQVLMDHWVMESKRRRALLWMLAERRRRREAEADLADAAEVDSLKYKESGE
jgi:hypothetical protein